MRQKFQPDYLFSHYTAITPDWLQEQNIKFILSDLDGTLAAQDEQESSAFTQWYKSIEASGTGLIVVSNNHPDRVDAFIQRHKLVGIGHCQKPFPKKIRETYVNRGLEVQTTLFLGDQVFTDVLCGKLLGVRTALVEPIPGMEPWVTKSKRGIEKILRKRWKKK